MTINKISSFVFPPPEPIMPSKDDMKMIVFQKLINRFVEVTAPNWKKIPELYLTYVRLMVNRSETLKDSVIKLIKGFIVSIYKTTDCPVFPTCDVVLCYSTPKSIWQYPMRALAERLSRRGFRVALLTSHGLEIIEYNPDRQEVQFHEVDGFINYRESSISRIRGIQNILRSLLHVIFLFDILKKDKAFRMEIYRNPLSIWLEFLRSMQYLDIAEDFIQQASPQLIVSNHIILPFSAELLDVADSKDIYRIWFCNENPGSVHINSEMCDEIWFWNKIHMASHHLLMRPGANIHMEISGHAETDMAVTLDAGQLPVTEEEARLKDITRGRRVLLYLSTYYPSANGIDIYSDAVSLELADWLEYVSTRHPDWYFIYKDRPVRFGEDVPGFDRLKKLPNWLFPQTEINFLNFLKWDNLELVAADSSLGLITAAGMKKLPVWLVPPSQEEHFLPNVEQVSLRVFSAETFDSILSNIDDVSPAYQKWFDEKQDEIFPHRGAVLDRMEELCIRRLSA